MCILYMCVLYIVYCIFQEMSLVNKELNGRTCTLTPCCVKVSISVLEHGMYLLLLEIMNPF